MQLFHDIADVCKPVAIGVIGIVSVAQVKDYVAVAVGLVTIVCTILVTRKTLKRKD